MDFSISNHPQNFVRAVPPAEPRATGPSAREGAPAPAADSVTFSSEGLRNARFLQQAKEVPEIRTELVEAFRDQVRSGSYPPPAIVDGLARLIGASFRV